MLGSWTTFGTDGDRNGDTPDSWKPQTRNHYDDIEIARINGSFGAACQWPGSEKIA